MSRLPRVAVLGGDTAAAAAVIALVDGGLETTGLAVSPVSADATAMLARFGLVDRVRDVGQTGGFTLRLAGGGRPPFVLSAGGASLGSWDAVVLAGAPVTAEAQTAAEAPAVEEAVRSSARDCFGGVFHPDVEGIFRVDFRGDTDPAVADAQARWIGEYLRGRYLLPARSVMVAGRGPLARPGGWIWRRALRRELHRGHARAALVGYPLPVPSRVD